MPQRFELLLNPRVAWTLACVCRTCKGVGEREGACPTCKGTSLERFEFESAEELRSFVEPLPDERVTLLGGETGEVPPKR